MTKWTAPDIASIRGDNSRPLQKIFGSLTEYLKDTLSQTTEVSQTYVRNGETTTLTIGTVVYLDAQQGDRATVKRALNTSDATSAKTLGVVAEVIPANADGLVTTLGYLEKVNTSAFTAGQTLYLGSTAGTFTATKPVAPNHMVYVGVVVRANAGNGIIYVRCQNGYELDEIHDVLITSPTTGDILMRNGSSLWINTPQTSITSVGTLTAGTVPASLLSGTIDTARISGSYTGITGVGTLTVGSIPATLLTGTVASARISGSYTGITGVGTITTGTWSGSFGAVSGANLTTLNASNISSGTLNNARLPAAATTITSVGTLTGLTSSGSISISRGALGTSAGNSLTFINPNATSSNGDSLNTVLSRVSTGSDWTTARWGIQRLVDATYMGGILFGYYNWDLIVNTTSYLSGSSITGVMTAGVPISGYSFIGTNSGNQNNYVKLGTNSIDSTTSYGYTAYANLRTTCGYGTGVSWYSNGAASPNGFVPNVHASFWASGTSSGDIRSNANNTTAYNTTSDYRLKKNVVDIDDAIERIRLLHPVKFEFKDPSNDVVYDGFLAHEVEEVAPYAVSGVKDAVGSNGEPMYQQIDTSWLVGLLTAGIQDLDKRLQILEMV